MDKDCINITLFGNFTITYHGETLKITAQVGKQLLNLLELLIYYRHNTSSKEIIINALWADNEHPAKAMKYAIFRLRSFLKNVIFLEKLDLITTGPGGYQLNPNYEYFIDTEVFDQNYHAIKKTNFDDESLALSIQMLELYNGDIYTLDNSDNTWIQQANIYYRSVYQNIVNYLCGYFMEKGDNARVFSIASRATLLVPDYESAHVWYLKALLEEGSIDKALSYYHKTVKMLNDVYDVGQSEELRAIYPTIILHNERELDILEFQKKLNASHLNEGAFYCEYDVFEYMYQNIVRSKSRTKEVYFLLLLNILSCPEHEEVKMMDKLSNTISTTLRFSDVFTRINKVQIAVLLQSKDEQGAHIAAQRILKHFNKRTLKKIKLAYHIQVI